MSIPSPIVLYNLSDATMKGLLPAGYTPLAYIESSGTLWINSEYVITSNKIHYSCKFKLGDLVSSSHIFGGNNSYSVYKGNPYISGNTLYFYINSSSYYNETVYKDEMLDIDMDMNAGSLNLYLNGKLHTASYSGTMSGGNSIALFHVNANNGTWNVIKGKMYYFKMWDNGSLVVDLHPCIQDSNGVIGMYDLVSRTFKTNSGSGSFIAGPPLAVGKEGGKSLPEEYLLVEYIRMPAGGMINPNFLVAAGTHFIAEQVMTFEQKSTGRDCSGINGSGGGYWEVGDGNKYGCYSLSSTVSGIRDKIVMDRPTSGSGKLYINGINTCGFGDLNVGYYTVGGINGASSGVRWKEIEYLKIISDDVVQRNMYACYRKSDMKPGMYDTVNGVFYTNAGSGEFILGPTVSPYYSWEPNAGTGTQQGLYTNLSGIYDSSKGWVADFTNNTTHLSTTIPAVGNNFSVAWWELSSNFNGNSMPWGIYPFNPLYSKCLNTGDGGSNPWYKPETTTAIDNITNSTWHHFVVTGNGSANYLYVDGVKYGLSKTFKGLTGTSLVINGFQLSTSYCRNPKISNFLIFNVALTDAQVKELYGK